MEVNAREISLDNFKAGICNVPLRKKPAMIPPFGSMYIVQALRKIGADVEFYNFDYFRPEDADLVHYFGQKTFDVVGISAVVSTAYAYTKKIAQLIKSVSPKTIVIVGGNLASSAEILLRKCDVDFCVIGDGEITIQALVNFLATHSAENKEQSKEWDYETLKTIAGICYLDHAGDFIFTGYRKFLPGKMLAWPDYNILEEDGTLDYYFQDAAAWFEGYGLDIPPDVHGKRCAWVPTAKGCINRCTFCHRFMRGYRVRPLEDIISHIKQLKEQYNVAVFLMFDEAFGSARKLTHELVDELGKLNVYWGAGSVRARSVNREILTHWAANGCKMATYGIESGSQRMLDIMEKNCTVQENIDALKWTRKAGITTQVQLVLAMPGETERTIDETIAFLKQCWDYFHNENRTIFKINVSATYAQALPGTPLYEYYRQHQMVGQTLDEEERYLMAVSNIDSLSTDHYINGTGLPLLNVLMWRDRIHHKLYEHYLKKIGFRELPLKSVLKEIALRFNRKLFTTFNIQSRTGQKLTDQNHLVNYLHAKTGSAAGDNLDRRIEMPLFQMMMLNRATRRIAWLLKMVSLASSRSAGVRAFFSELRDAYRWSRGKWNKLDPVTSRSLRDQLTVRPALDGSAAALPLRKGN